MRKIVGFVGRAGVGKSTAAFHLLDCGWTRERFAGRLKAMSIAFGLSVEHVDGELKEVQLAILNGKTPREFMQLLGTEFGRNLIGKDIWINAWKHYISQIPENINIVTDDVRFQNEADAIHAAGGKVIMIKRLVWSIGYNTQRQSTHVSENVSHITPIDATVFNDTPVIEIFLEQIDLAIKSCFAPSNTSKNQT